MKTFFTLQKVFRSYHLPTEKLFAKDKVVIIQQIFSLKLHLSECFFFPDTFSRKR